MSSKFFFASLLSVPETSEVRMPAESPVAGNNVSPTSAVATEIVKVLAILSNKLLLASSRHVNVGAPINQYGLTSNAKSFARLLKSLERFKIEKAKEEGVVGRSTELGSTPKTVNAGEVGVLKELNDGN